MGPGSGRVPRPSARVSEGERECNCDSDSPLCKSSGRAVPHGSCRGIACAGLTPRVFSWHRPEHCDQLEAVPGKDFTSHEAELGLDSELQETLRSPGASAHHREGKEKNPL